MVGEPRHGWGVTPEGPGGTDATSSFMGKARDFYGEGRKKWATQTKMGT